MLERLVRWLDGYLNKPNTSTVHPVFFTSPTTAGQQWQAHYRGWTAFGDTPKEAERKARRIGDRTPV